MCNCQGIEELPFLSEFADLNTGSHFDLVADRNIKQSSVADDWFALFAWPGLTYRGLSGYSGVYIPYYNIVALFSVHMNYIPHYYYFKCEETKAVELRDYEHT